MPTPEPDAARLIETLVADARPVRRLWAPGWRLAVWAGVGLLLLGVVAGHGLRPDVAARLREPLYVVDLVCIALLAALLAHRACVAAIPGRTTGRLATAAALVCAVLLGALTLGRPASPPAVSHADLAQVGMGCLVDTVVLALVPASVLLVAVQRGAPSRPGWAGAAAGAAGWLMAYFLVRLGCGVEDGPHLGLWHLVPGLAASALARGIGVAVARRR